MDDSPADKCRVNFQCMIKMKNTSGRSLFTMSLILPE